MKKFSNFLGEHIRPKDIKMRWYIKKVFKNIGDNVTLEEILKEMKKISTYKSLNRRTVRKVLDELITEKLVDLSGQNYFWDWSSPKNLYLKNIFDKVKNKDVNEEMYVSPDAAKIFYIHKAITQHINKVHIEDLWADVKTGPGYHILRDMQRKEFNDIIKQLVKDKKIKQKGNYYQWKANLPKRTLFNKFLRGLQNLD